MKKSLAYLLILFSFIPTSIIAIDAGIFQLSLFRIVLLLLILFTVFNYLGNNIKISLLNIKKSYSLMFMLIWLAYGFLSILWVKDYLAWFKSFYFLFLGVVSVFVLSIYFKNKSSIFKAFRLITLIIIIHNFFGWIEILYDKYYFLSNVRLPQYITYNYPVSMFGNTNDFATFLLVSVFILLINLSNSKNRLIKLLYFVLIVSTITLLFYTTSRSNIIGLFFGVFVYLLFKLYKIKRTYIFPIILTAALITLMLNLYTTVIINYLKQILEIDFKSSDGSPYVRINLIRNGMYFLSKTLGFGVGLGNVEYWMRNYSIYNVLGIENMHNWWFEILTSFGIAIFIMYILFYCKLLFDFARNIKLSDNKSDINLYSGLVAFLVAFIFGSISSSSIILAEWFWIIFAILISLQIIPKDRRETNE